MAGEFFKEKLVSYLNKDFQGFKRNLVKFAQAHHSGSFRDFNESSTGMALLEFSAYVGDVLAFYMDKQFSELDSERATQRDNVVAFAKSLGYRPAGKRASRGQQTFFVEVPAANDSTGVVVPDPDYLPILTRGARVGGPNGTVFETLEDLDFSKEENRMITGSQFSADGTPTHFAVGKVTEVVAGETKVETFSITDFESFKQIELGNTDVIEILSVVDSDGNAWYEVDYLAQNTIYESVTNTDSDSDSVPYILKLTTVPRRFISDRDPETAKTSLIFGSGDGIEFDDDLVPNLADLSLPLPGRATFTTYPIDPQNFLKTKSLGLSPYNTTLTVSYRVGGGPQTNVNEFSVKNVLRAELQFSTNDLNVLTKNRVESSIECLNMKPFLGGGPEETIQEVKANSAAFFASQNRVVTREDFIARVMSLPVKYGKPDKVYVKKNKTGVGSVDIHILSKDTNGHLQTSTGNLKGNIKTYISPYRMLTDGLNILDSRIINIGCEFGIVASRKFNRSEVLGRCLAVLVDELSVDRLQIGQPIVVSELLAKIQEIVGVVSVYELRFVNLSGPEYSSVKFDPQAALRDNILYCPEDSIFEVKYPRRDIVGVVK